MKHRLACVLALNLGIATFAAAQNTVPYGTNVPTSAPAASLGAVSTADPGPALPIASYAKPGLAWFNAEYVYWWVRDQNTPSLVQTVPDSLANASQFPAGSVSTLFPQKNQITYPAFNGLRLTGGLWLNSEATIGLDGSAFMLEQNTRAAAFSSTGSPILARSYTSANAGQQGVLLFSSPDPVNGYSGAVTVNSTVSSLFGADANVRWNGYPVFADNSDYLFGVRYLDFRERLDVGSVAVFNGGGSLIVADHFATTNQFYGAQIGVDSKFCGYRGFSLEGIAKFAIGAVHQTVNIEGYNTLTSPAGVSDRQVGGLYAQPSNIGTYSQNKFAILPEFTLNLGYNFTDNVSVYVGYNILWLNTVARPGDQINPQINDANVRYVANPTAGNSNQPTFGFHESSFWVQGITVGMRVQF